MFRVFLIVVAALVALFLVSLAVRSAMTKRPSRLSGELAELAPCRSWPNCVSSQATRDSQRVEPLPLAGSPAEALDRARAALESMPRTRVVTAGGRYLHAECTSLLFRFVDDVELLADPEAGVLHVRSASRTGRSDLGVNRRRVERLRKLIGEA